MHDNKGFMLTVSIYLSGR